MIRLACIVLILALEIVGSAVAEDNADAARVDNGTMDLVTSYQGYYFTSDQSISGVGFANSNSNLAVVDSDDGSKILDLKAVGSGTGSYSYDSSTIVQNNVVLGNDGVFTSSNRKITAKETTDAVYEGINFQIPGSFRVKSIRSLWKDQTWAKNYAGIISMNSLFDYARTLHKESTTTMYSDQKNYAGFWGSSNSSIGSSMDINSKFEGLGHLGATINDVRGEHLSMKAKPNSAVLMDEDYMGSFNITKKMAVKLVGTLDYGDYDTNYDGYDGTYPWLPCSCNTGWDGMVIHDQRYHSAKGFFDCTTCLPPGPCKN